MQLHIHAVEFDYLCQRTESATVMLGNPGALGYLVIYLLIGPQKWFRNGHFLARAENMVLPLYRMVVQHMKNQILTEVTAELEGATWSVM